MRTTLPCPNLFGASSKNTSRRRSLIPAFEDFCNILTLAFNAAIRLYLADLFHFLRSATRVQVG